MRRAALVVGALVGVAMSVALAACDAVKGAPDPRYPREAAGCDVVVYPDGPKVIADNLGSVSATCNAATSDAECLRQLEDEVCKLGGDIAWGVPSQAHDIGGGERKLEGRAAHTHVSGSGASFGQPGSRGR